jgi:hypothetical protein
MLAKAVLKRLEEKAAGYPWFGPAGRFLTTCSAWSISETPLARRFGRFAFSASSAFSAALARCSFFAAASNAVRVVAASSSASASQTFRVQN